jgi:hypothetical protein
MVILFIYFFYNFFRENQYCRSAVAGVFRPKLKALYVSLVRYRLEYAFCVWQPFNVVHIDRIERIQKKKFIKYAHRRLGWNANSDLSPYHSRCGLINLETLEIRRDIARIMFVFDILSG